MKRNPILLVLFILLGIVSTQAQVTIGSGQPPMYFSILEVDAANTKGGLRLPQISGVERDTISVTGNTTTAPGLTIYNTTTNALEYWNGTSWVSTASPVNTEPFQVSGTTEKATSNTQDIYQMGNVGVGVTTPTNRLHVSATTNPLRLQGLVSGVTADSLLTVDATGVARQRSIFTLRKDLVAPPAIVTQVFPGMIKFDTATNTLQYYNGTTWVESSQPEPWFNSATGTGATGNTQNIYQMGNVGIGVTSPTNRFHISATSNPVRMQGLVSGVTTDSLLTVDANGVAKQRSVYALRQDIVKYPSPPTDVFPGMLRYNSTTKQMEYYDGTAWQAMAANVFGGKNEGLVRILGGNGGALPTLTFTTQNAGTYQNVNYTTPLSLYSTYWPENQAVSDANIVGTNGGNTTYIENSIAGQVHTWRVIITYSGKNNGSNIFATIRLRNPVPPSTFTLQQTVICPTGTTTGVLSVIFISIADNLSLPAPNGTGNGYVIDATADGPVTLTVNSVTRISSYKD